VEGKKGEGKGASSKPSNPSKKIYRPGREGKGLSREVIRIAEKKDMTHSRQMVGRGRGKSRASSTASKRK